MPQTYPMPRFHFVLSFPEWASTNICFNEVSGLRNVLNLIVFKGGKTIHDLQNHINQTETIKRKVYLKRGIIQGSFTSYSDIYNWLTAVTPETQKRTIIITLRNEEHESIRKWIFFNTTPVRIVFTQNSNDVQIEILELEYKGYTF